LRAEGRGGEGGGGGARAAMAWVLAVAVAVAGAGGAAAAPAVGGVATAAGAWAAGAERLRGALQADLGSAELALQGDLHAAQADLVASGVAQLEAVQRFGPEETSFPFGELDADSRALAFKGAQWNMDKWVDDAKGWTKDWDSTYRPANVNWKDWGKCKHGVDCWPDIRYFKRYSVAGTCDVKWKSKNGEKKFGCSKPSINQGYCLLIPLEIEPGFGGLPLVVPLQVPLCLPDPETMSTLLSVLNGNYGAALSLLGIDLPF